MSYGDEMRARRLAREIARLALPGDRYDEIVKYGNARYQEGYDKGSGEGSASSEEKPVTDAPGRTGGSELRLDGPVIPTPTKEEANNEAPPSDTGGVA